jgi:hypothetical protein
MRRPYRAATTAAVGFLLLDAVLLFFGGVEFHKPSLVAAAGLCLLAAGLVLLGWRRYRRTLDELAAARHEMKADLDSLRGLLKQRHLQN